MKVSREICSHTQAWLEGSARKLSISAGFDPEPFKQCPCQSQPVHHQNVSLEAQRVVVVQADAIRARTNDAWSVLARRPSCCSLSEIITFVALLRERTTQCLQPHDGSALLMDAQWPRFDFPSTSTKVWKRDLLKRRDPQLKYLCRT